MLQSPFLIMPYYSMFCSFCQAFLMNFLRKFRDCVMGVMHHPFLFLKFTSSRVDSTKLRASCSCSFFNDCLCLATIEQLFMYLHALKCISCIDLLLTFVNAFLTHRYSLPFIFILIWSVLLLRKSLVMVM